MPGVVAAGVVVVLQLLPDPLPPHESTPQVRATRSASMTNKERQRRRAGMNRNNKPASSAPPVACHGGRLPPEFAALHPPELAAVVVTVSVAVPFAVPVMLTGVVDPKLNVGSETALAGLVASTAVRATLPVKPLLGVTVIAEAFPVVEPGVKVIAVPVMAKLEGGMGETMMPELLEPGL